MAVTFTQSPVLYNPSDNPIVWVFNSTQASQPNFRFLVEVFQTDGMITTLHSQHFIFPNPRTRGKFDLMPIAQALCNVDDTISYASIVQENRNWKRFFIKVTEVYGSPLAPDDDITSSEIIAFKGCFSNEFFVQYQSQANQYIQGGISRRFSTFRDRLNVIDVRLKGSFFIGIINDLSAITEVKMSLYNESNTVINSANVTLDSTRISLINLDPELWISSTSLTSSDFNDATYFEIFIIRNDNNTRVSEIRRFNIDKRECYFGRQITFLNKFGTYETFVFFHNQELNTEISEKSYGRGFGDWVGLTYVFDPAKSGEYDYLKQMQDKATITSDYINENQFNWLVNEVLESPLVMAQNENQTPYKVLPRNAKYTQAQGRFDELFDLSVECYLPNVRNSPLI